MCELRQYATPILDFGGTSESSPLTAGEAALVIQAYRSTHRGADPSPALVKEIIMSTAADLGAPAFEQGAGIINSLAAVNAALSVHDGNGSPAHPVGDSLLNNPSLASVTDLHRAHRRPAPSRSPTRDRRRSTLSPALQKLGAPFAGATIDVQLHPATDPTFLNPTGAPRSYVKQTFTVPAGTQHLDAAIAFKTNPPAQDSPFVYFGLFDPSGREVTYSNLRVRTAATDIPTSSRLPREHGPCTSGRVRQGLRAVTPGPMCSSPGRPSAT